MSHSPPVIPTELILSPSKARAHATTSQAWSEITSWLNTLFPSSTCPPFERSPATLAYLQSLMRANVSANQTRRLLLDAQTEQLGCYERYHEAVNGRPERKFSRDVEGALSEEGRVAVEELARTVVRLSMVKVVRTGSGEFNEVIISVGGKIQQLSVQLFEMQNRIEELNGLKQRFQKELVEAREAASALEGILTGPDAEAELERIRMQTAQYVRETKQISLKMNEYRDRLAALSKQVEEQEGTTIEDVRDRAAQVERRREGVRRLEERLWQFNGLPPDVGASREEVKRAGSELERWRRKREEMFERM